MHTCERCGYKTRRLDSFKRHLNRKNPCTKKKGVVSSVVLDDPKRTVQKKIYNCEICGVTFANRQNKYRHKNNVNCKPPPEVCQPIAGDIAVDALRQLYMFTTCPTYPVDLAPRFPCVGCGKNLSNASNLTRHKKSCTGVANPLQCDVCMKVFSSSGAKSRHKKNVKCKPPPEVCQPIAERQIRELQEEISILKIRKKGFTEGVKKRVASGQGWKCNLCDCNLPHNYQVDHIQAVSLGGQNDISNAQALCKPCHQMKTKLDALQLKFRKFVPTESINTF